MRQRFLGLVARQQHRGSPELPSGLVGLQTFYLAIAVPAVALIQDLQRVTVNYRKARSFSMVVRQNTHLRVDLCQPCRFACGRTDSGFGCLAGRPGAGAGQVERLNDPDGGPYQRDPGDERAAGRQITRLQLRQGVSDSGKRPPRRHQWFGMGVGLTGTGRGATSAVGIAASEKKNVSDATSMRLMPRGKV